MVYIVLLEFIKEVLKLDDEILKLAKSLYQERSLIVMGRGYNFATCLEGALVSLSTFIRTHIHTCVSIIEWV